MKLHYKLLKPDGSKLGCFDSLPEAEEAMLQDYVNKLLEEHKGLTTDEAKRMATEEIGWKEVTWENNYKAIQKWSKEKGD